MRTNSGSDALTCTVTPPMAIAVFLYSVALCLRLLFFRMNIPPGPRLDLKSAIANRQVRNKDVQYPQQFRNQQVNFCAKPKPSHFIGIFKMLAPKPKPRQAKEHTAGEIRPPQDPGRDAPAACKIQVDGAAVAADGDHAPENLVFMDWCVVRG